MKPFIQVILLLLHYLVFYFTYATKQCTGDVCIPSDYDKLLPPLLNETNEIHVSFNRIRILNVDDYECTITLKFELFLSWLEPRLIGKVNKELE